MTTDELFMTRAYTLALGGKFHAAPNPMVGAVIVHDGKIIGEGFHRRCGQAHAEVNAIASVKDQALLPQSTLYVTLEPCSHYGKTPPCADLIIEKKIKRVVVGCTDPFEKVHGNGIKKLLEAGIDVTTGVLREKCEKLNAPFITFHTRKRPYITLKWAQSADGFIGSDNNERLSISTPFTQMLVHRMRAYNSAIMVGSVTAKLDNPSLTTRLWPGKSPLRVVTDRHLKLPQSLNLFDGTSPTLVFTTKKDCPEWKNVEFITIDEKDYGIPAFLNILYEKGCQTLLVEGGSRLLQSFIDAGTWDKAPIETRLSMLAGNGTPAPQLHDATLIAGKQCFGSEVRIFANGKSRI